MLRRKRVTKKQEENYQSICDSNDKLSNNELGNNEEETEKQKMLMQETQKLKEEILMKKNWILKLKRQLQI